jgi:hypothetical protein
VPAPQPPRVSEFAVTGVRIRTAPISGRRRLRQRHAHLKLQFGPSIRRPASRWNGARPAWSRYHRDRGRRAAHQHPERDRDRGRCPESDPDSPDADADVRQIVVLEQPPPGFCDRQREGRNWGCTSPASVTSSHAPSTTANAAIPTQSSMSGRARARKRNRLPQGLPWRGVRAAATVPPRS